MKQYIDKSDVVAEIDSIQNTTMDKNGNFLSSYHEGIFDGLSKLETFIDSMENPFDKDLKDFAESESELFGEREYECDETDRSALRKGFYWGCEAGAQWQKQQNALEVKEAKEVDIENAAITEWSDYAKKIDGEPNYAYMLITREDYISLAKHFYELGQINTRKED